MLRRVLFASVLTLLLLGCHASPPAPTVLAVDGATIDFNALRGKWVVLNYWASWCRPCYQEIPVLNAVAREQADQVVVLGVSLDRVSSAAELNKLIQQMGIDFPTLATNPGSQLGIGTVSVLPSTFIFNPQGKRVAALLGEQTQETLLAAMRLN